MNRKALEGLIERGVADGAFPLGAAAVVCLEDSSALCSAQVGTIEGTPVSNDQELLFDLASLTKPFVASAVMRLIQRGELALDRTLGAVFPELGSSSMSGATVEMLLAHESGLEPWLPLFEAIENAERGTASAKQSMLRHLLDSQRERGPASSAVYSDLGYILLGEFLARHTGATLAKVVEQEVTVPLGLSSVSYRSTGSERGGDLTNVVPTEDCPWRGRILRGEVHDDNAWTMGGTAGHAGLFGTVGDVARFGRAWLLAMADDDRWLDPELARLGTAVRPAGRPLCFDLKSDRGSSAGSRMGARTFGHLGYTGCSLWIDPHDGLVVALATNRVRFGRNNTRIRAYRPWFHDELFTEKVL